MTLPKSTSQKVTNAQSTRKQAYDTKKQEYERREDILLGEQVTALKRERLAENAEHATTPAETKSPTNANTTLATARDLWRYIWPAGHSDLKRRVIISISFLLLTKATSTLSPFVYKWLIDAFSNPQLSSISALAISLPMLLAIGYCLLKVTESAFMQLRDAIFAKVGQHAVRRLAYQCFKHLHELSLRFHISRQTGSLSRIVERAGRGVETIVRFITLHTAPTIVEVIVVCMVFLFYLGPLFFLTLIVTIIGYIWFTIKASNWRMEIRRRLNRSDNESNNRLVDSLLNYETVKYFNNEQRELGRFDHSIAKYEKASVDTWVSLSWLNFGQNVIFWIGVGVCLTIAANNVTKGIYTVGDIVLIVGFLMQIYRPLSFMGSVYREVRQGLIDIEAMFDLLRQNTEITDAPNAKQLIVKEGEIAFENVHFSYDKNRKIIKGITFKVPANKSVALVGPSGAGKSTISKIIFRFYDANVGRVLIDGQNIKDITQQSLRSEIGIVPQDTVLFNDTIGYNIAYGRPDASFDEVQQAAKLAQIDGFINSLPDGYDTLVGERGLKISGGEKQRVAIARTILKSPPILILDEATSALDSHTEKEIQNALDAVAINRTTLIIAHRLSTVVNADEILVLEEGVIVERGTHDDLLAKNGAYGAMWNRQRAVSKINDELL